MSVTIGRLTSDVDATRQTASPGADTPTITLAQLHVLRMQRRALDLVVARTRDHDHDD